MTKIKTILMVLLIATLLIVVSACWMPITGSGNIFTEVYHFTGFTEVEVQDGFQLELIQGSAFSIKITADDNVHEYVNVEKEGNSLSISLLNDLFGCNSCTTIAEVTMPDLTKLELSGGSQANISGFNVFDNLSLELSGGSQLNGDINFTNADFNLSGGSQINLEGAGDTLIIDGSGGSQLDLELLPINNADITLSGGGKADINVSSTLSVNLSGGSQVNYIGQPTLGDIDLSGSSTISSK
ncbi:MAG: DUF2807 domain-containing protein [Dehalococcoidia bacterium]|nr:MAG: DUF2807 domain-containing protein [Dehalococcoidia bacterium]